VLNRVYAYFLQQATALARLAQAQLAFERQEPEQGIVQDDYWQGPPEPQAGSADTTDRRGLTGSARLLQDITRLDQYAFQTDGRKLHLTQTLSVSQFAARELQQFRQTGVLTFATPLEMFDREFPGHYLRLVKRVRLSLLAVVPPVRGIRAQLSASGTSRTVVAAGPFDTVTLRRDPEVIAFTSPTNATGLFELEPDSGMLIPFEGMGVDTVWRLDLPKAANPFDYNLIADVLLTLEYTALDSQEYRQKAIRSLDRGYSADRTFSLRTQFPDAWYDLNNPDTVQDPAHPMHVVLPLTADDFPPHIADLAVAQLAMFVVRDDSISDELTVTLQRSSNALSTQAGPVSTTGGVASTRRPGGAPWQVLVGTSPVGTWELQFDDTPAVRYLFSAGKIQDVALVFTISGTTPEWP
jgi:Tc toxin complex TcA C-terminal TcB-binding domain